MANLGSLTSRSVYKWYAGPTNGGWRNPGSGFQSGLNSSVYEGGVIKFKTPSYTKAGYESYSVTISGIDIVNKTGSAGTLWGYLFDYDPTIYNTVDHGRDLGGDQLGRGSVAVAKTDASGEVYSMTVSSSKALTPSTTYYMWFQSKNEFFNNVFYDMAFSGTVNATAKKFKVTYNANGGSGAPAAKEYTFAESGTFNLSSTAPTRTGYKFLGWSTSSSATSATYAAGGAYNKSTAKNVTLYAVWQVYYVKIRYNANGGSINDTSKGYTLNSSGLVYKSGSVFEHKEYKYGDTASAGIDLYNRGTFGIGTAPSGYTATEYWEKTAGSGGGFHHDTAYATSQYADVSKGNKTVTLYAQWRKSYTISYNVNGGSGTIAKTYAYAYYPNSAGKGTLTSSEPTKSNYSFLGWATSSTATTATYGPGASIENITKNTTLYAVWQAGTYKVTYKAPGATGVPSAFTGSYNSTVTLNAVPPRLFPKTCQGYQSTLHNKKYIPDTSYKITGNDTLTAIFEDPVDMISTYTYTTVMDFFNKQYYYQFTPTVSGPHTFMIYDSSTYVEIRLFDDEGTKITSTYYGTLDFNWEYSLEADKTYYIQLVHYSQNGQFDFTIQPKTYNITYYTNASNNDSSVTNMPSPRATFGYLGDEFTFSHSVPTKFPYNFGGWYCIEDGSIYWPNDVITLTGSKTLYPQWENPIDIYSGQEDITFDFKYDGEIGYLKFVPEFTGSYALYSFSHKLEGIDGQGSLYNASGELLQGSSSDVGSDFEDGQLGMWDICFKYSLTAGTTYYYQVYLWSGTGLLQMKLGPTYNLKYYNGMTGAYENSSQTKYYKLYSIVGSDSITVSDSSYAFVGWESSLTGNIYHEGDQFSEDDLNGIFTINLTTQWEKTIYLTYNNNYNNAAISLGTTIINGRPVSYTLEERNYLFADDRENYECLGWSTDPTATTAEYVPGDTIEISSDTTLYAVWQKTIQEFKTYYCEPGGGVIEIDTQQATSGPVNFTVFEYNGINSNFMGWSLTDGATTPDFYPGDIFTTENTLNALFAVYGTTIHLQYNSLGGTYIPHQSVEILSGGNATLTISSITPQKNHHEFLGWYAPGGEANTLTNYYPGDSITIASSTCLQAVWRYRGGLSIRNNSSWVNAIPTICIDNNVQPEPCELFIYYDGDWRQSIKSNIENYLEYEIKNTSDSGNYGFKMNDRGFYENSNKKQSKHNSYALCEIYLKSIKQNCNLYIDCIHHTEYNSSANIAYDYGILSNIISSSTIGLTRNNGAHTTNTGNVKYTFYKGPQSNLVKTINYGIITPSMSGYKIEVKYRKDGSSDSNNDSLQFRLRIEDLNDLIVPEIQSPTFEYSVSNISHLVGNTYYTSFGSFSSVGNNSYESTNKNDQSISICKIDLNKIVGQYHLYIDFENNGEARWDGSLFSNLNQSLSTYYGSGSGYSKPSANTYIKYSTFSTTTYNSTGTIDYGILGPEYEGQTIEILYQKDASNSSTSDGLKFTIRAELIE